MREIGNCLPNPKAKRLFAAIRRHGPVSKFDLQKLCGLTPSTLTRLLDELCAAGWIEEHGLGESSGGRRPVLYRIRPRHRWAFGLDISRTYSKLVLCDLTLEKIDSVAWLMTGEMTPDVLTDLVARAVSELSERHNIKRSRILGLGIGAVGPVDRNSGTILNPLYFPAAGWNNVPICAMLERLLSVPVLIDNGANTALLGEYWAGAPNEYRHVLYVRAGVGLRSAMMSNGQLVYGAVDMEGAVGHMIIQTDGPPHPVRRHVFGCLESFVSIPVLERQAISRIKQGRRTVLTEWIDQPERVDFPLLIRALQADDPMVAELFVQAATYFGIGLSNLLNILHPELVILGGPLIATNELFYRTCTQVALKNALYYPDYQVLFSRGNLSDDAIAIGAAAAVVSRVSE